MTAMEHTRSPFLELPTELRLDVYDYIVPEVPLAEPRPQWAGIAYVCRQLKLEVEPLIVRRMRDRLARIAEGAADGWGDGVSFSDVETVTDLRNMEVTGYFKFERTEVEGTLKPRRWNPLLDLLDLHLVSLTIRITDSQLNSEPFKGARVRSRWIFHRFTKDAHDSRTPRVKKFRLEWRDTLTRSERQFRPFTNGWIDRIKARGVWCMDVEKAEDGTQVAVTFERLGRTAIPRIAAVPTGD